MSSTTILVSGAEIPLTLQLSDGNAAQFPQAVITNASATVLATALLTSVGD